MKLERIVIGVLAVLVAGQAVVSCAGRAARRREQISAANQLAAASKTETFLRGQLQVATRYIYQHPLALERELRNRPATLKAKVDVALEARHDTGSAAPPLTVSSTSVAFHSGFGSLDTTGYRIENDVLIAGVGAIVGERQLVGIDYDVRLAPVRYKIRVSCEGPNARVAIAGPRWRGIGIDSTSGVTEDVCNPPLPSWQPFSLKAPSLPWAAGLVTLGFFLRSSLPH